MASLNTSTDILSSKPLEIIHEILQYLPIDSLKAISQTNKNLRDIVKSENSRITKRFSKTAKFLNSKVVNGWITPTHPIIRRAEYLTRLAHNNKDAYVAFIMRRDHNYEEEVPILNLVSPVVRLQTKLSVPGPHYLLFLEKHGRQLLEEFEELNAVQAIYRYKKKNGGLREIEAEYAEGNMGCHPDGIEEELKCVYMHFITRIMVKWLEDVNGLEDCA